MRRSLAVAALIAIAGVAFADSTADEAEMRFRRGTQLYKQGKYEDALVEFFTSNRLARNKNVGFNIARSYEALKRYEEAYRYYAEYLAADGAAPDQATTRAKLAELSPRVALVRVTSEPAGATVYVDRRDLGAHGETPLVLALPPGPHKVIVERAGHHPLERDVTLIRGAEVAVPAQLELVRGELAIASQPVAEFRIDRVSGDDDPKQPDGMTPAIVKLAPGNHAVELRAPGHRPARREIVIVAGKTLHLSVKLEPIPRPTGTVAIGGQPGAQVAIDGKPVGVTPLVAPLAQGRHVIAVTLDGHDPWTKDVDVSIDAHMFLQPDLRPTEPSVVGAMRAPQRVSDAPASVTVLDGDELRAFGYETLADALRVVRGIYEGNDGNYRSLGVRGFARPGDYTNRVLVLRDGHTWNDDLVGSGFVGRDFAPDLDDVARIEVVRGPGSAFYGQGAFFGVVNVITLPAGEGPGLAAGTSVHSDGGGRVWARGSAPIGKTGGVAVSASVYGAGGRTLFVDGFRGSPSGGFVHDADGEDAERVSLRLRSDKVSLDATWNRRRKDIATASFGTEFDPTRVPGLGPERTTDQRGYVEGRYEDDAGGALIRLRVYADYADYDGEYPYVDPLRGPFMLSDTANGFWFGGEARLTFGLPLGQRATLGIEASRHIVDMNVTDLSTGMSPFADKFQAGTVSGYLADEITLSKHASITASLRLDLYQETDRLAFSPRLAAVFEAYERGRTKIIVGRAFRSPSLYEQHYHDGGISQRRAGPIAPETIDSAEVEHTHRLAGGAITGAVFASRILDLIGLVADPGGVLVYENSVDWITSFGAELELRHALGKGAWIGGALSFAHVSGDDGARTNSTPFLAVIRGLVPLGEHTRLASEAIYNAPRRLRDGGDSEHALIVNVMATGKLARGVGWHAGIQNVFDWRWSVPVGSELVQTSVPQDGRRFVLGLTIER